MLADHDETRNRASHRIRWPATVVLIAVSVVLFVVQEAGDYLNHPRLFDHYLALSPAGLAHGWVWQLLTFQFLHANIYHLLGNMITIYFLGRAVEAAMGRVNYLKLYLLSGMLGGLLQAGAAYAWPAHFGNGGIVGASAGACGLVAALAVLFPRGAIHLFFIPVAMPAWAFASAVFLVSAAALVPAHKPGLLGIAHGAHLGGLLAGFLFAGLGGDSSFVGTGNFPGRWNHWVSRPQQTEPA